MPIEPAENVDPSTCWNCGAPVAADPDRAPGAQSANRPSVRPDPMHALLTLLTIGGFVLARRYGVDLGGLQDVLEIVGGASAWGHVRQVAVASAYRNAPQPGDQNPPY